MYNNDLGEYLLEGKFKENITPQKVFSMTNWAKGNERDNVLLGLIKLRINLNQELD